MRIRRIAVTGQTLAAGETVALDEAVGHYLVDVLRCAPGQPLEIFDGDGGCFAATLVSTEPPTVELAGSIATDRESPCRVTLYQAMPKGDRFEMFIEKATELGVTVIVPLETARSVVRVPAKKAANRVERWLRIAESAARQSGRAAIPEISAPLSFAEALERESCDVELLLQPGEDSRPLDEALPGGALDVGVWVGPEGGFDPHEVEKLAERAVPITLGPRILRSETAGIVACALVQARTGGLR